jgi:hypothetical protein
MILFHLVPCVFRRCHKNASICVNNIFYAECVCDYGFAGDGIKYCDECGITYSQHNARIGMKAFLNKFKHIDLLILYIFKSADQLLFHIHGLHQY